MGFIIVGIMFVIGGLMYAIYEIIDTWNIALTQGELVLLKIKYLIPILIGFFIIRLTIKEK